VWTVSGQTFEGSAGDIFVIKAAEIRSFKAVGDSPLVQLDVHLSPHSREAIEQWVAMWLGSQTSAKRERSLSVGVTSL
jgi:quercetin dioxygenase-like cupin family protein